MFIINKRIAVQTVGIRYVQKIEPNVYSNSNSPFGIRIKYKAAEVVEYFQKESERDEFFNDIVTSLKVGK